MTTPANTENPLGLPEIKSKMKDLPVKLIRESNIALRSVQRQSEAYQGLVDSVRTHGVLQSVLVREDKDPETNETFYWLIDGLQRYNACKDAGREMISAKIVAMDDAGVLESQIILNVHKIETRPVEYSKQLLRVMAGNPTMTISNLAVKLSKSPTWVSERLGLVKLDKQIADRVDDDKINLSNAYALAKLPPEEQINFVDRAMTLQPQEFVPQVNLRVKELRDAKRQGRDPEKAAFQPVAHCRKVGEIKDELNGKKIAAVLVAQTGIKDPVEAFNLGIQWVLNLDPVSVKLQYEAEEARVKKLADAKAAREAEKLAKKGEAAAAETADMVA